MKTIIAVLFLCSASLIGCSNHEPPKTEVVPITTVEVSDDGAKWITLPQDNNGKQWAYWRQRIDGYKTITVQAGAHSEPTRKPDSEKPEKK